MSQLTLQEAIGSVIELLQDAKQESLTVLKQAPESGNICIIVGSGFDTLVSRLSFIGGVTVKHAPAEEYPPITSFMGEEIIFRKEVTTEDISASEAEKQAFIAKVDRLFLEIESISPDGILNNYTLPEDQLVLRGVAKRAGVVDFSTKELNLKFIEEIVAGKNEIIAKEKEASQIEAELLKQEQITKLTAQLQEAETKGEGLSADLADAKAALADAKTAPAQKKAEGVVKGIEEEIEACVQLQLSLDEQITALKA